MSVIEVLTILNAAMNLASEAGVNIARYNAMRELSDDGTLTLAQLKELESDAKSALSRLPDVRS